MKVALVTGAAGGLGTALATAFLRAGWRVAAGIHRTQLQPREEGLLPVSLDVTDPGQAEAAVRRTLERWGRLDVLVNNAGITVDQTLARASPREWERVIDVNLRGAARVTRAALAPMLAQRDGHVLSIGSLVGKSGGAGQSAYAAAKAGLIGFTQAIAREYGERNIRANVVLPGVLSTPMTARLTATRLAELTRANALGRLNTLEEVAGFIAALAALQNVSGQVFQLDSRMARWW